jgi:hypothetical protein
MVTQQKGGRSPSNVSIFVAFLNTRSPDTAILLSITARLLVLKVYTEISPREASKIPVDSRSALMVFLCTFLGMGNRALSWDWPEEPIPHSHK